LLFDPKAKRRRHDATRASQRPVPAAEQQPSRAVQRPPRPESIVLVAVALGAGAGFGSGGATLGAGSSTCNVRRGRTSVRGGGGATGAAGNRLGRNVGHRSWRSRLRLGKRFGLDDRRRSLGRLHQTWRRQCRSGWLCRLGAFLGGRGTLAFALDHRRLGKDVSGRQRDVALLGETVDKLPRDDFLDGARGALHLDAVIALQQRGHFLARRVQQLRDLINPNS
jgi:hypothetical protein